MKYLKISLENEKPATDWALVFLAFVLGVALTLAAGSMLLEQPVTPVPTSPRPDPVPPHGPRIVPAPGGPRDPGDPGDVPQD